MMSMQMDEKDWGEQRLAARKRRQRTVRIAMVGLAVAFGLLAPRFVPQGPGGAEAKLALSLAYIAMITLGAWLLWRGNDELVRRRAVNTFAAIGATSFVLTLIVMLAAPIFHLTNPTMIVWCASLAVGAVAFLIQWLRS